VSRKDLQPFRLSGEMHSSMRNVPLTYLSGFVARRLQREGPTCGWGQTAARLRPLLSDTRFQEVIMIMGRTAFDAPAAVLRQSGS
jgi:hypothetical protein